MERNSNSVTLNNRNDNLAGSIKKFEKKNNIKSRHQNCCCKHPPFRLQPTYQYSNVCHLPSVKNLVYSKEGSQLTFSVWWHHKTADSVRHTACPSSGEFEIGSPRTSQEGVFENYIYKLSEEPFLFSFACFHYSAILHDFKMRGKRCKLPRTSLDETDGSALFCSFQLPTHHR